MFLYVLKGLSPYPCIGMKFKSQWEDEVNGNYSFRWYFVPGLVLIHKLFKDLFDVKVLRIHPKPQKFTLI